MNEDNKKERIVNLCSKIKETLRKEDEESSICMGALIVLIASLTCFLERGTKIEFFQAILLDLTDQYNRLKEYE